MLRITETFPGTLQHLIEEGMISVPEYMFKNSLFIEVVLGCPNDRKMLDVAAAMGQIKIRN